MPFVRIKRIKNKEYAYLVENAWKKRKKGSRQKTLKYLGRVHHLEQIENIQAEVEENHDFKKIITNLLKIHLKNYGFNQEKKTFMKDNIIIDFENNSVTKSNRNISIQMNEGFLNTYTLRQLYNYKPKGDMQEIGFNLANVFVSTGLVVPQGIFIQAYGKLLEEHKIESPVLAQLKQQKEEFNEEDFYY